MFIEKANQINLFKKLTAEAMELFPANSMSPKVAYQPLQAIKPV